MGDRSDQLLIDELTCKPLDSLDDIKDFLENPPPWRSLCEELKPHSKYSLKNIEINKKAAELLLETPQTFCHVNLKSSDVQRHDDKRLPKTLVCHDMANGYHDDSIIEGTAKYDAYTFYNWAGIDIFCYFSHHLITIPPLGWINVGHAHGVKVIGTVITEWANGAAFWEDILNSKTEWQKFASSLVAISKTLKFDGWLMNIENKISKPEILLEFLQYLHKQLHQELKDAVLIWYDSVTIEGQLSWQNALNEKNKDFFDACDGIFTNYSWTEANIASSVALANDRVFDVFVGIDVWGRNFYGGGQFNTRKAIKLAHKYGCSLAIFAQAWTYEAMDDESDGLTDVAGSDNLTKYERFLLRDRALWGSIWPYLNTKLPSKLPFQTSFCRGQGRKRRLYGEVISPGPWFNLRHMHYQPNSSHGPHGYLLSTVENIFSASCRGLFTDKKSVIECRESLNMNNKSFNKNKGTLTVEQYKLSVVNEVINTEEENAQSDDKELPSRAEKRKMTDFIKKFFHSKTPKFEDDSRGASSRGHKQGEPQSHREMTESPVKIKLQTTSEKTQFTLAYVPGELECLEVYLKDSFVGGSCLKVNPSDEISLDHRTARLFHCDFKCKGFMIACLVTKALPSHQDQFLTMKLHVTSRNNQVTPVYLIGSNPSQFISSSADDIDSSENVYPINTSLNDPIFKEVQRYLLLNQQGFYISVGNGFGWKVWYYLLDLPPSSRITSINCRTGLPKGPVLLGHFGLCHKPTDSDT